MKRRVLVVGPGALGVIFGARLAAAGLRVTGAARDPNSARKQPGTWTAISQKGARIDADVPTIGRPGDLDGAVDAIILATKCSSAVQALKRWLPELKPRGVVVALQNGIIGDELAALAGDRLIECTVAFPATLLSPGISEQTGPGTLIIGAWPDARMEQAAPLKLAADLLGHVETTRVSDNMRGVKWTKLLINSAISGLGVLTGQDLGTIFDDRRGRMAAIEIVSEGYRAGLDQRIDFEKVAGLHPSYLALEKPQRRKLPSRHLLLRYFARRYRRQRSSSLQSLDRGQQTEVAYLNARIVEESLRADRSAPVNQRLVELVADIEAGHRSPSMDLLDEMETRFHRRGRPLQKKAKRG